MPLTSTAQPDAGLNLADNPHTGWHGQVDGTRPNDGTEAGA